METEKITIPDPAMEYASLVREAIGPRVKQLILFGSRARGDAKSFSDYDFILVVDSKTKDLTEIVFNIELNLFNKYDIFFSALIYDEKQWEDAQFYPLAWNVQREGIAI